MSFRDLVGSVELGERMDAEDYRDLLARFRDTAVGAIGGYHGFILRHQGNGVLVYFGYPQAHQDDAERSVRAGLQVVRAVEGLYYPYAAVPTVRVGIATGPAVVGDVLVTGAFERSELAALGPTPNLAARLQGEAEPNSIVISDTTQRLVQGLVMTKTMGALSIKGLREPSAAYRVVGETGVRSRLAMQESIARARFEHESLARPVELQPL